MANDDVLGRPEVVCALDLERPVAVLMIAVLHFLLDADQPGAIVRGYRERVAPGSYLALSHVANDQDFPGEQADMIKDYRASTQSPFVHREPDVLAA